MAGGGRLQISRPLSFRAPLSFGPSKKGVSRRGKSVKMEMGPLMGTVFFAAPAQQAPGQSRQLPAPFGPPNLTYLAIPPEDFFLFSSTTARLPLPDHTYGL